MSKKSNSPTLRSRARTTVSALRAALALIALGALSACDLDVRQDAYFLMEFDAEIEGERFTFETKIACKPRENPTGTPGESEKYFGIDRASYGMKLKSGKGAFVAAPNICVRYFAPTSDAKMLRWSLPEREKAILPAIYITDDYENPRYLTLYINPKGPDPKTGVRLIQCVVRPLTSANAATAPDRPLDMRDPFVRPVLRKDGSSGGHRPSWAAYAFFPLSGVNADRVRGSMGEVIMENSRYRLHRLPKRMQQLFSGMRPLAYTSKYWLNVRLSTPLNDSLYSFKPSKYRSAQADSLEPDHVYWALQGFSKNLPLHYDGNAFSVDFENAGVLYAMSQEVFEEYLLGKRNQRLIVGESTTDFDWAPIAHELLLLDDLQTKQLYTMTRFQVQFRL